MKSYLALFRARFRTLLQYRMAAWAGVGTQLFWGIIKLMVLEAFYKSSVVAPPLSFAEAVTYTWLGQAFLGLLPFTANPDPEVKNLIRSGSVAYELARPLDLYALWYTRQVAARSAPTLLRCVPQILIAVAFLGMGLPPDLRSGVAAVVALVGALLLSSAFMTVMTVMMLWTVSGDGVNRIAPSLALLGSGLIIPLPLFPDAFQPWLDWLPFAGMADSPFRLWMGHLPPEALGLVVLRQMLWTLIFVLLGRVLLARGVRTLTVAGG